MKNKIFNSTIFILCFIPSIIFAQSENKKQNPSKGRTYGTNIIRLAPFRVIDIGPGFGFSYEKIIGKDQMIGIELPLTLALQEVGSNYNGKMNNIPHYYFTPGVKIYPFGQRKVTYAVGPNLMLAYGKGKEWTTPPYDPTAIPKEVYSSITRFRFGVLINNYINFQLTENFNIGLEGGLGMRYFERKTQTDPQTNITHISTLGFEVTGQFAFTLGFRF